MLLANRFCGYGCGLANKQYYKSMNANADIFHSFSNLYGFYTSLH